MFVEEFGDEGKRFLDRLGIVRIQETCVYGAEVGSRPGHVKSDESPKGGVGAVTEAGFHTQRQRDLPEVIG